MKPDWSNQLKQFLSSALAGTLTLSSRDRGVFKVELRATPVSVEWVLGKTQQNAPILAIVLVLFLVNVHPNLP